MRCGRRVDAIGSIGFDEKIDHSSFDSQRKMTGVLLGKRLSSQCFLPRHRRPIRLRFSHVTVGAARKPIMTVKPVVDVDWLKEKYEEAFYPAITSRGAFQPERNDDEDLRCVMVSADSRSAATMRLEVYERTELLGRNPVEEYRRGHIPGAQFFDVNSIADG